MPQLIIAPYNHVYLSIICILGTSFLLFVKYFLPLILSLIKIVLRIAITNVCEILFQIFVLNLQSKLVNMMCLTTVNLVLLTNVLLVKIVFCFCREYLQHTKLCKYINNNIFAYLQKDLSNVDANAE